MKLKRICEIIAYTFLTALLILTAFPIIYTLLSSFKTNQEFMSNSANIFPSVWQFGNYKEAWLLANFSKYTFNTVYMTTLIVIGVLAVTSMAGYSFARGDFLCKRLIFLMFTATMFLHLGSITMFPLLKITNFFGIRGLNGIVLLKVFGLNIVNTYLIKGYVENVPRELDEAATIDGCGFFQTFYTVILPIMKPILATVSILVFKASWNDYLLPMVFTLGIPDQIPLSVGVVALKSTGESVGSWNLMLAGAMIGIMPMIIVYLALNRFFVEGLTSGAVKG